MKKIDVLQRHMEYYRRLRNISKERVADLTIRLEAKPADRNLKWLLDWNTEVYSRASNNINVLEGGLQ